MYYHLLECPKKKKKKSKRPPSGFIKARGEGCSLLARDGLPLGLVGEEAHGVDVVGVGEAEPVVHDGRLSS